jgi:putative transcriptional regulator
MAIVVTLDEMLHRRRMTLTELSALVGITLANLSILKTNKARGLRFETLAAICAALDCQPGDLLRYDPSVPEEEEAAAGDGDAAEGARRSPP